MSKVKKDTPVVIGITKGSQCLVVKSVKVCLGFSLILSSGGYLFYSGSLSFKEEKSEKTFKKIDILEN
jgi:hypothetical protein